MPHKIAFYLGENGETISLTEKGKLIVFEKQQGVWQKIREKSFQMESISSIKYLRFKMEEIISFLDDCKIFVANSVVGIPYYMLEKAQKSVWECLGKPHEFIDDILAKEEEAILDQQEKKGKQIDIKPEEISPGKFSISLGVVQEAGSNLTSKQVLIPFLTKEEFSSLEIICSHIPLWLQGFSLENDFEMEELENFPGRIRLLLTKKGK